MKDKMDEFNTTILIHGFNSKEFGDFVQQEDCPLEVLNMVLERGCDDVISWIAFGNPNCPNEVKLKWWGLICEK